MFGKTRIKPGSRLPLCLTHDEHALFVKNRLSISTELEKRLRVGRVTELGVMIFLELADFDELSGAVADVRNHCRKKREAKKWNDIFEKIMDTLHFHTEEEETPQAPHPTNPFQEMQDEFSEFRQFLQDSLHLGNLTNKQDPTDIKRELDNRVNHYHETPQKQLGGLSPLQLSNLLYSSWKNPDSPLCFNRYTFDAECQNALYLKQAYSFLSALDEENDLKATGAGNLPRTFVTKMLEKLPMSEKTVQEIKYLNKVFNEHDVLPLYRIRIVSTCAGLIKKQKNVFSLTKKGKKILQDHAMGELYWQLFTAFFYKFDIASIDGLWNFPALQETMPYNFWKINQYFEDWEKVPEDCSELVLPVVLEEPAMHNQESRVHDAYRHRIITPLIHFDLMKSRESGDYLYNIPIYEYKITSLYNKFILFNL